MSTPVGLPETVRDSGSPRSSSEDLAMELLEGEDLTARVKRDGRAEDSLIYP